MRLRYRLRKSLIMIPALMAAVAVHGQGPSLLLNNYKIPVAKKGALVGQIFEKQHLLHAARLVEDTSGLFRVGRKGELRLKQNSSISADAPSFKYAVTVQSGNSRETFILVRDDFHRNKVVAHRGAWKNTGSSQNSLSSLKDAIRIGVEGTEFDVWLSKDNVPVLSHDNHIGDKKVEETLAADFTAISLNKGDHVPTFEDYILEGMKQNTTHLVLELKPSGLGKVRGEELATKCVELIRKHKCEAWMLYISFDYDICKKIVELNPFAKVAYLKGDKTPAELKADKIWGFDYNFKVIDKDINIIKDAKKNGINVNVWTVNAPEQMDVYLKAGVDYLTTDEPEILLEKVK